MPSPNESNDPIPSSGVASGTCTAGRAAKISSTAAEALKFINCSVAGSRAIGLFDLGGAAGDVVRVISRGEAFAIVMGASVNIAADDELACDANGKLVKAIGGDYVIAISQGPATTDDAEVKVFVVSPYITAGSVNPNPAARTTGTEAITAAQLVNGGITNFEFTANGAVALSIPAAAAMRAGTQIRILKTGTAGAITITPAAGTIAASATHAAIDADNDFAIFENDIAGANWRIAYSIIA